jgi:murein DD-endopeptidase MepM/ murein hydrolase activator NlpD
LLRFSVRRTALAALALSAVGPVFFYLLSAPQNLRATAFLAPRKAYATQAVPVVTMAAGADEFGFPRRTYRVETLRPQPGGLAVTLEAAGLSPDAARRLADAARREGLTLLAPDQPVRVYRAGDRLSHVVVEPDARSYVVLRPGLLPVVSRQARRVEVRERMDALTLVGTLARTVEKAGLDAALADTLQSIFGDRLDLNALGRGTQVQLVLREEVVSGTVLAAEVLAVRVLDGRRVHEAYRFVTDEAVRFYDGDGGRFEDLFLRSPVEKAYVSSAYSLNRFHPVQQVWKPHYGTDFAAPTGTPVVAVGDGVVLEAGFGGGNGNYVKLRHDRTYTTGYLHFSRIAPGIRRGAQVRRGQVIGYVGQTGLATGPHVCFRFWKNDRQVDFLRVPLPPAAPVAKADRAAFEAERDRLRALFETPSVTDQIVTPLVLPEPLVGGVLETLAERG